MPNLGHQVSLHLDVQRCQLGRSGQYRKLVSRPRQGENHRVGSASLRRASPSHRQSACEARNRRALDQKHRLEEKINELNSHPPQIQQKMKVSNNLNQLLSRVKTIFSHKACNEEKTTEPTTQQPSVSDQRLKAALAEVEKYLADNFRTAASALTYEEYTNGISLTSDDPTFSTSCHSDSY